MKLWVYHLNNNYGEKIRSSKIPEETEIPGTAPESLSTLRTFTRIYEKIWNLPHLFQKESAARGNSWSEKSFLVGYNSSLVK